MCVCVWRLIPVYNMAIRNFGRAHHGMSLLREARQMSSSSRRPESEKENLQACKLKKSRAADQLMKFQVILHII